MSVGSPSLDYIGSFSVTKWLIHFDSSENRNVFNMNLALPLCDDVSCVDDASAINQPIPLKHHVTTLISSTG